jgi:hypothetical protein
MHLCRNAVAIPVGCQLLGVHRVHADTMYNGRILPPDYNRSNREDVNIVLEVRDNERSLLMCPTDRGNDPTVDSNELERVDRDGNGPTVDSNELERVDRDGNGPLYDDQWKSIVMGTDRCTMTSGRWYRTHAERGRRETEWSRMD